MSAKCTSLDLRAVLNEGCQKCKSREERKNFADQDLCIIPSVLDGLPVRCVGDWAEDKIYRLSQYFGIFAQGMHKKWDGLNYVEICSGPGRCLVRHTSDEIDGTAMAILNHPKRDRLSQALFIDLDEEVVDALNSRIKNLSLQSKAKAVIGDYRKPDDIVALIETLPKNCLNLIFIDPTHCDVPFSTVEKIISAAQNVDLLVNVSIGTDVSRNLRRAVLEESFKKVRRKYENFLGDPEFFNKPAIIEAAKAGKDDVLRRAFGQTYSKKLEKMGFKHWDVRAVKHYYYLLFASRSERGLDFWIKACSFSPSGQKEFNF